MESSFSASLIRMIMGWKSHLYCADRSCHIEEESVSSVLPDFAEDYRRWYPSDRCIDLQKVESTPQLIAPLMYRLARHYFLADDGSNADILSLIGRQIGLIEIFYSAKIGPGMKINHGVGSVVGARCTVGRNFTIHQGCTLGDRNGGRPTLGDNVTIYAGASVLGNIKIGDNSVIGANATVIDDFPANSVLLGTPAKAFCKR